VRRVRRAATLRGVGEAGFESPKQNGPSVDGLGLHGRSAEGSGGGREAVALLRELGGRIRADAAPEAFFDALRAAKTALVRALADEMPSLPAAQLMALKLLNLVVARRDHALTTTRPLMRLSGMRCRCASRGRTHA